MHNPTLKEFVEEDQKFPLSSYVKHEDFDDLYVRRSKLYIRMEGKFYICKPSVQIANVVAKEPGKGAFTKLVDYIVNDLNRAVYVENAHNPRLKRKLERMGFVFVNKDHGPNYLFNYETRLIEVTNECF